MTMLDRAIAHMMANPNQWCSLNDLRKAAGIALRSQYRLCEQLCSDGRVVRGSGNLFSLTIAATMK